MCRRIAVSAAVLAVAICVVIPVAALARGGGGGGGGGHGGGGGGGHGGGFGGGGGHSGGGFGGGHGGWGGSHSSSGHAGGAAHGGGLFGGSGHSGSTGSHGGASGGFHHAAPFVGHYGGAVRQSVIHHPGWEGHHGHGYPNCGYGYGGGGWTISVNLYSSGTPEYGAYPPDELPPPLPDLSGAPPVTGNAPLRSKPIAGIPAMTLAEIDSHFPEQGEDAFRQGDYHGAVYYWRHALLDDPENPLLLMLLGQALFATEAFHEAAGATQAAMYMLPNEQWGVVVVHHRELYGDDADYTRQLRELERSIAEKPEDPALRFLAGFHYAYLGFPQPAIHELDKGLKAQPRDEIARQLRDDIDSRIPKPAAGTLEN